MKGTLKEPLIGPASPEHSEVAKPENGAVHHEAPQFGHHGLPSKDYEVCACL